MKPMKLELIWAGIIAVVASVALLYLGRYCFGFLILGGGAALLTEEGEGA